MLHAGFRRDARAAQRFQSLHMGIDDFAGIAFSCIPTPGWQGCQARLSDAVGQCDANADRSGLHAVARLIECSVDAWRVLQKDAARMLRVVRSNSSTPKSASSSLMVWDNGDCSICSLSTARAQ